MYEKIKIDCNEKNAFPALILEPFFEEKRKKKVVGMTFLTITNKKSCWQYETRKSQRKFIVFRVYWVTCAPTNSFHMTLIRQIQKLLQRNVLPFFSQWSMATNERGDQIYARFMDTCMEIDHTQLALRMNAWMLVAILFYTLWEINAQYFVAAISQNFKRKPPKWISNFLKGFFSGCA